MLVGRSICATAAALLAVASLGAAQTTTSCNPTETTCSNDEALGMAIDVDFTQGEVNSFTASGGTPTYGSDGVTLTVTEEGDAPQLNSVFYIMFGKVEITMKCANGTGIVSSVVLQSDDLDEIDVEVLGVANEELQTMYFGKGERATDAEVTVSTPDNQAKFVTYTIDWTADRIIWSVDDSQVRILEYADADGYYPQTPMQLKFGVWAGGDPDNAAGTISWAGGTTDYTEGPFSMIVQSVSVTDYSTGTEYKYGNESGLWQSIESVGGEINSNVDQAATATTVSGASSTGSTDFPASGIAGVTSTSTVEVTIPSGWHMTSQGKIVPNSAASITPNAALLCGPLTMFVLAALLGRWQ
ncbi:concanavalin A-like lectin/glucanase domain-containing protein [Coniella lustricola]|uniref:Crh-like protein n=1 Tax=Coniella lustricola TaxID=2025994 RepID=A0A2T3ADI6_9PEZI|nr:concanavalin A-like lectin/glucanase domain-containing protein [Coniella lustricola]